MKLPHKVFEYIYWKFIILKQKISQTYYWKKIEMPKNVDFIRRCDIGVRQNKNAFGYSTYSENALSEIFSKIEDVYKERILDFGAGKAFVLCLAIEKFSFKSAVGIEIMPELCKIAHDNINTLGLINQIQISCMDAVDYKGMQLDFITCIYMYNPFKQEIMKKVMENIEDSIRRSPREIMIVYANPTCEELFDCNDNFKLLNQICIESGKRINKVNYYQVICKEG